MIFICEHIMKWLVIHRAFSCHFYMTKYIKYMRYFSVNHHWSTSLFPFWNTCTDRWFKLLPTSPLRASFLVARGCCNNLLVPVWDAVTLQCSYLAVSPIVPQAYWWWEWGFAALHDSIIQHSASHRTVTEELWGDEWVGDGLTHSPGLTKFYF